MRLVVLGTGGQSLELAETATLLGHDVLGFLDDADPQALGPLADAAKHDARFVCGIGSPKNFRNKRDILRSTGLTDDRFITLAHPSAAISPSATLAPGSCALQQTTLGAKAHVGAHTLVLPQSVVSHHAVIGECSTLAGGVIVSGNTRIGQHCYVGAGAVLRDGITIGDGVLVGMGAVVTRDVGDHETVIGVPAARRR